MDVFVCTTQKMCSSFLYYVEMFDGGPIILMDVTFFSESEYFFKKDSGKKCPVFKYGSKWEQIERGDGRVKN